MRAFLAAMVAGACLACAAPSIASVSPGPGVHIDPGSPAAKQYQIPIVGARDETSGGSHSSGSGSDTAPTFGSGVTASDPTATTAHHTSHRSQGSSGTGTSGAGSHSDARHARRSHRSRTGSGGAVTVTDAANRSSTTQANQVGSSSWVPLAAGGALVLLLGCGGGLALKRRS